MNEPSTANQIESAERLLREIHYELARLSRQELIEEGMTPPRFHLLHHVVRHAPIDMGAIHRSMHLSRSSLTSLVDGLVEDRLIARTRDPHDRRRVVIEPTASGLALLERLRESRCARLEEAMEEMDEHTVSRLIASLEHLARALEAQQPNEGACR
ncbi:MAG: MarR family winged helix-turn-helix transcriptional regulator [Spirochaetota bacterium]